MQQTRKMPAILPRLLFDLAAALLLIAGLAYWWLDNFAHEVIGLTLFGLIVLHLILHRRWFGLLGRTARHKRGRATIALNMAFACAMTSLLVSSVAVSRDLLNYLPFEEGGVWRSIHIVSAYWVVVTAGVHVGLNWHLVLNGLRSALGVSGSGRCRSILAAGAAAGIAIHGAMASVEMAVGSKLIDRPVLDMWDFNTQTPRFFLNWMSILGLYAVLAHYGAELLANRRPVTRSRTLRGTPPHPKA